MTRGVDTVPDDVLFEVCVLLFREGRSLGSVTRWLQEHGYPNATREWPGQLSRRAFQRGILTLPHREDLELGMRIHSNSGTACRVSATEATDEEAFDAIAELAAHQVLLLIRQVQLRGREIEPPRKEAHIGLAAGGTSRLFAAHLARLLERERKLPRPFFHALTTGFFVDNPSSAPVVSLAEFSRVKPQPGYRVLYSTPLVSREEAKRLPERPFARQSFEAAHELDIVVTSVSAAGHGHGLFRRALMHEEAERAKAQMAELERQRWAGDIMWQPYSEDGNYIDIDSRAATVVDFQDLVRLSNNPAKHVVCIAGPCADCGASKEDALIPLMRRAPARRPFNYLVTTEFTARAICDKFGWKEAG